jgi:hypothetical protein
MTSIIDDEVIALAQERIDAVNRRGRDARRRRIREMAKLGKRLTDHDELDIFFTLEWIALSQKVSAAEMLVEKLAEGAVAVTATRLSTGARETIPPALFRGRRQ